MLRFESRGTAGILLLLGTSSRSRQGDGSYPTRVFINHNDAHNSGVLLVVEILVKGDAIAQHSLVCTGFQIESQRLLIHIGTHSCLIALHKEDIELAPPSIALLNQADLRGGD